MPITFTCSHCEARMTVPDQFAGKRGKCSKCKGAVLVPAVANGAAARPEPARPAPGKPSPPPGVVNDQGEIVRPSAPSAPPPPPEDLDAVALSALADEPRAEEKPTDFVEFNCPQCDEPLKLPVNLAGKKHPCPECRRIITVPIPKKKDPANWRDTGPNLPSGAKRDTGPALEGAWGTAQKTGPSQEALQEAGVIQEKHKPATLFQRAFPYLVIGSPVLLLIGGGVWLYLWMGQLNEKKAYDHAAAFAASDDGAKLVRGEGLAALHAHMAEYQQKAGHAEKAREEYGRAVARAQASRNPERDALLLDLLPAILSLAGSREEVDAGGKRPIAEVQKVLVAALRAVGDREARLEGVRRAAALLAERKDAARALPVTMQVYASADADRYEALAAVGLELLKAGNKEQAAEAARQALEPFAEVKEEKGKKKEEKKRPELRASVVAVAVALARTPPAAGKSIPEQEAERVGRAAGLARKGQPAEARALAGEAVNEDVRFRMLVEVAEATGEEGDVTAALDALRQLQERGKVAWQALRLAGLARAAKLGADRQEAAASAVPPPLTGWAHLRLLRSRLEGARSAEGMEGLEKLPAQSLAANVARLELARHNTRRSGGWSKAVRDWEEGPKAFGMLGVALGMQGK